ncbi:MAG: glutathione S-transferase family protein [Pseudomonadota bacterium]
MVTLYHCADARSFRALWALEELGVPYELKLLPFPPRLLSPSYLEINPLGTIPFFVDGQAQMTESAAIVQYLAVKHGGPLAVAPDDPAYGDWLNWLHRGEATLTFPQTLVLRYTRLEPKERRNPQVAEDYARWFMARLRSVDAALEHGDYLCAGRFTAADVSVGYALLLARTLGLDERFSPAIKAYWAHLKVCALKGAQKYEP